MHRCFEVKFSSDVWEEDFWESTEIFDDQVEAEQYIMGLPENYRVLLMMVTREENCTLRDHMFEGEAGTLSMGASK